MPHFEQWSRTGRARLSADPLMVGDVIVLAHKDAVAAYDLYTGQDVWGPVTTVDHSVAELAHAGNRVFLRSYEGSFANVALAQDYAMNGFTGRAGDAVKPSEACLIALDAASGHRLTAWTTAAGDVTQMLDPVTHDDVLILRETDGKMQGFETSSGKAMALWSVDLAAALGVGAATPGPAAVSDGMLTCVVNGQCVAVNTASGGLRWTFPGTAKGAAKQSDYEMETGDHLIATQSPGVDGDLVVVAGERAIYGLDARTGRKLWKALAPEHQRFSRPTLSKHCNRVYVTTDAGKALILRRTDGVQLAELSDWGGLGAPSHLLPPVLDHDTALARAQSGVKAHDDMLVLANASGHVWCLRVLDGQDHDGPPVVQLDEAIDFGFGMERAPVVANGSVVGFGTGGEIRSESIGDHKVAHFDGSGALHLPMSLGPERAQADMTLELWVRSSHGGDLVTQSCDANGAGFRLSLVTRPDGAVNHAYGEGAVQLMQFDNDGRALLFAQTPPSPICDGKWHHLALRRTGNKIAVLVDGIGQHVTTLLHRDLCDAGDLAHLPPAHAREFFGLSELAQPAQVAPFGGSAAPLTLGALDPTEGSFEPPNARRFRGLIAEMRLWDTALGAEDIADRMAVRLTGQEHSLRACYPLVGDEDGLFRDAVSQQQVAAEDIQGVATTPSNLILDNSLFPYLLPIPAQWPHDTDWCARGLNPPRFAPVGTEDVVVFAAYDAVYAVEAGTGKRLWSVDTNPSAAPICCNQRLYVCADGLAEAYALDTGLRLWQADLPHGGTEFAQQPIHVGAYVVFSTDGEHFHICHAGNGKRVTSYTLSGGSRAPAVARNAQLYLAAPDRIVALDLRNVALDQTLEPDAEVALSVKEGSVLLPQPRRLFVANGNQVFALDLASLTETGTLLDAQKSLLHTFDQTSVITGIAADAARNILVVTTQTGVHFLERNSGRPTAHADVGSAQPHAPMLEGGIAYVALGGGADDNRVRAFDGQTGADVGSYTLPGTPVGAALKIADTLYVATDGGSDLARQASATHAVAFGSTLSQRFLPDQPPLQISDVAATLDGDVAGSETGQNALRQGTYTLEVWINAARPTAATLMKRAAGPGKGGFALSVGGDGRLQMDHHGARTQGFASVPTGVLDGRWHHIAVVMRDEETCQFFVDGTALPEVLDASVGDASGDPDCVEIGGGFDGLITEARIWSTWLHPAEIAQRKSTRLTGNEPDLVAAWSFDQGGLVDSGRFRLAKQASAMGAMVLSELDFVVPSYATLEARSFPAGKSSETKVESEGVRIIEAHYEAHFTARTAAGEPRARTKLQVWVRERCDVTDMAGGQAQTLDPGQAYDFETNDEGKITLQITSTNTAFSPVLLVRADFMHDNARLHVPAVAETDELIIVPPPRLIAQSALIEDYADLPGEEISLEHGRTQSLYTTLTAKTASGNPLPGVRLEIRGERPMRVSHNGKLHWVGPDNALRLRTDMNGSVVLVFTPDANPTLDLMSLPALSAWASFMSRDARVLVEPSDCIHAGLKNVTADHLLGKQERTPGAGKRNLLKDMMQKDPRAAGENASALAEVMRHISDMGARAGNPQASAAGAAAGPMTDAVDFSHIDGPADSVFGLISREGQGYDVPVSPGYMAAPHFAISLKGGKLSTHSFATDAGLDAYVASRDFGHASADAFFQSAFALSDNDPAGSIWDKLGEAWDDVVEEGGEFLDDAEEVVVRTYNKAKEGVSKLYHRIEVAVRDAWGKVKTFIVKTAKAAWKLMKSVLDAVGVFLQDLYDFIVDLFDWGDVLEARDVVRTSIEEMLGALRGAVSDTIPHLIDGAISTLKDVKSELLGTSGAKEKFSDFDQTSRKRPAGNHAAVRSHVASSKSNFLMNKLKSNDVRPVDLPAMDTGDGVGSGSVHSDLKQDINRLVDQFSSLLSGERPFSLHAILEIVDTALDILLDLAEEVLLAITDMATQMLDFMVAMLEVEIEIPFISAFYKAIAGRPLSILDFGSLLMAVPLHVVGTVFGIKYDANEFSNAAAANPALPVAGQNRNAAGTRHITDKARHKMEVTYLVMTEVAGVVTAANVLVAGVEHLKDMGGGQVDDNESGLPAGPPRTPSLAVILQVFARLTQACSSMTLMLIRATENEVGYPPGFENGRPREEDRVDTFWEYLYVNAVYLSNFGRLAGVGIALGLSIYDLYRMAKSIPILNSFGAMPEWVGVEKLEKWGVPKTLSFVGGTCLVFAFAAYAIGAITRKGGEAQAETGMNAASAFVLMFSYANSPELCRQYGQTFGVPNSSIALSALQLLNHCGVQPALHFGLGFGKDQLFGATARTP